MATDSALQVHKEDGVSTAVEQDAATAESKARHTGIQVAEQAAIGEASERQRELTRQIQKLTEKLQKKESGQKMQMRKMD